MIDANDIINTAKNLKNKGIKYSFGSTNIEGGSGDCSSFTQYVFRKNGILIGRDTQAQYTNKLAKSVDKNKLAVGDLIFFKNTYNSNNTDGVSHVGIYTGNNNFIHLSSTGVKESSLNENYWQNHYLGAKRFSDVKSINSLNENYFTGENVGPEATKKNKYEDKKILGVNINEIVNAIICILFIIGGMALIGLSIGGM